MIIYVMTLPPIPSTVFIFTIPSPLDSGSHVFIVAHMLDAGALQWDSKKLVKLNFLSCQKKKVYSADKTPFFFFERGRERAQLWTSVGRLIRNYLKIKKDINSSKKRIESSAFIAPT